jgi:hypothetical protein
MAQALTLTYGRVKYIPGSPRQTSHGMRINAVITLPLGEEIKLWGDPGDPALTALTKGQQVALAQNAKGGWQLVQQQETPQQHQNGTVQNQQGWEPEDREIIAAKIEHRAKVMRYCLLKAQEHCGDLVESEESIRAIATSLFIEVLKK